MVISAEWISGLESSPELLINRSTAPAGATNEGEPLARNVYEGLFIFDANKFARDHDALPKAVEEMISSEGGEVVVSRLWEERRLAYAVKGQRKGAYWLIYFRQDGEKIGALNRACELKSGLLRHLVLKIHPRLEEPILEHAAGTTAVEDEVAEGDSPAADAPAAEEAAAPAAE